MATLATVAFSSCRSAQTWTGSISCWVNRVQKYHTTQPTCVGSKWRKANALTPNYTACGPLTDLPDFTYKDGSPAPPGPNKVKKFLKHRAFAERIIELTGQIDHAVERHERLAKEKEEKEARILQRKLKPKTVDINKSKVKL